MGLCKCGCGQEVKEGNLYVHGHNRRGLASYTRGNKWSMKYDKCVKCGTVERKHVGKGLCIKCHRAWRYEFKKQEKINKWARNHDKCVDCGRTDRPHHAHGRCGTCHTNYVNRQKGIKKRNIGDWSWYYSRCRKCGTTKRPHAANGLCCDCYRVSKRDLSADYMICPVCKAKVVKLNQHISMRSKKCKKHQKYHRDLFEMCFKSDLGLDDIAKELKSERHVITKNFRKYFGKKETDIRNQKVKSCLCSEKAALNYNLKNLYGTIVYYDSLNNGKVRFRSNLERQFAEFLDRSGVKWVYEYKSFPYIDKDGRRRTYTPDFYFVEKDRYIEIKGYKRDKDEYKVNKLKEIGIDIMIIRKGEFENAIL